MRITVTTNTDKVFVLDVSDDLDLENFKAFCESESGIKRTDMIVVFNGKPLQDNIRSLKALGLNNGDCVLLQSVPRRGEADAGRSPLTLILFCFLFSIYYPPIHYRRRRHQKFGLQFH